MPRCALLVQYPHREVPDAELLLLLCNHFKYSMATWLTEVLFGSCVSLQWNKLLSSVLSDKGC